MVNSVYNNMAASSHCTDWLKYCVLLMTPLLSYGLFEFKSYRHEVNPNYVKAIDIQLIDYNNQKALNGCIVFSRDIEDLTTVFTATTHKKMGTIWTIVNKTIDSCELLVSGSKYHIKLFHMMLRAIQATSPRFPDKCPLKQNREYCFSNFHLGNVNFPIKFPPTKINVHVVFHDKNVAFYTIDLAVNVE